MKGAVQTQQGAAGRLSARPSLPSRPISFGTLRSCKKGLRLQAQGEKADLSGEVSHAFSEWRSTPDLHHMTTSRRSCPFTPVVFFGLKMSRLACPASFQGSQRSTHIALSAMSICSKIALNWLADNSMTICHAQGPLDSNCR